MSLVMPNGVPWNRLFYPIPTQIMYSFLLTIEFLIIIHKFKKAVAKLHDDVFDTAMTSFDDHLREF